ncbi:MAG: hypothetical protein LIP77_08750 [Planctomycetes bacterium]|nr:hypothetical protein [Planctomycetota bacterium]
MELVETVTGHCEIRNQQVELLMVVLKKAKHKPGSRTPLRCQSSGECPKSSFCRFVNPLTTRIPVNLDSAAEAS